MRTPASSSERSAARRALVSRLSGYSVQRCKAIVGANAFAHEAGIHQDGVLKDVSTYQIMDPEELGLTMTLPLGKHSGRHTFARACSEAGIQLTRDELNDAARTELARSRRRVQGGLPGARPQRGRRGPGNGEVPSRRRKGLEPDEKSMRRRTRWPAWPVTAWGRS